MKKSKSKNKVYISLFISYIIVFLLPMTVAFLITIISSMLMLGQVVDSSKTSLEHARSILDAHFENAFFNTSSILTNTSVASLKYKDIFTGDDIDDLRQLQRTMGQVSSQDYFISDLFLVFNKSDAVLSSSFLNYGNEFDYNAVKKLQMSYEEFKNSLVFEGTRKVSQISQKKGRCNLLLYNKNTHNSITKDTGVTVIATINPDNFRAVLDSLSDTESEIPGFSVYLADLEGNILESGAHSIPSPDLSSMININIAKRGGLRLYYHILLNHPLYATAPSSATGIQYVFVQNQTAYSKAVLTTVWICLVIIVISAVAGISFCYRVTTKQYSPMQMLVDRMLYSMENNNSIESTVNEYEIIERSLNSLIKQKRSAEDEIAKYQRSLADSNLRDMLMGYRKKQVAPTENIAGDSDSKLYQTIIYSAENLNFDQLGRDDTSDESILDLISAFIFTIVNEYNLEGYIKKTTMLDDNIVCLISPEEDYSDENVIKMVNETVAHIKQSYNIDLIVGISSLNKGFAGISHSYNEANEVLEYSALLGLTNSIMNFNEIPKATESDSLLLPELSDLEHRYLNCIKACDFENARAIQDQIISICFRKNKCTPEQTKYRLYGIINIAMTGLEDVKPLIDEVFWNSLKINERLLTGNISLKKFIEYSDEIFTKLHKYFEVKSINESSERDVAIVNYVNENYTDSRLSIALLSDIFEMSPSYLSKTFKKATGKGLLDYIHALRIEKAKQLIKSTDYSLKVIAEEIGYSNNLTLIRAFKRYEGITPSAYKESL